jgi:hypothetical protein
MLTLERELREYQGPVANCQGEITPGWLGGAGNGTATAGSHESVVVDFPDLATIDLLYRPDGLDPDGLSSLESRDPSP